MAEEYSCSDLPEFIDKLRKCLIASDGFVWHDTEYGVKWHLRVSEKEQIEESLLDKEIPVREVIAKDNELTEWLKQ